MAAGAACSHSSSGTRPCSPATRQASYQHPLFKQASLQSTFLLVFPSDKKVKHLSRVAVKVVSTGEAGGARLKERHLTLEIKGFVGTLQTTTSATRRQDSTFFPGRFLPVIKGDKEFPLAEEACEWLSIDWLPQLLSPVLHFITSGGREGDKEREKILRKPYPNHSLIKTLEFLCKAAFSFLKS